MGSAVQILETDMQTGVHQATPKSVGGRETTCRKPLEAVLHETRSQDQEQGPVPER